LSPFHQDPSSTIARKPDGGPGGKGTNRQRKEEKRKERRALRLDQTPSQFPCLLDLSGVIKKMLLDVARFPWDPAGSGHTHADGTPAGIEQDPVAIIRDLGVV
jgi:hypothetical protein